MKHLLIVSLKNDYYELPQYVAESLAEIARVYNINVKQLYRENSTFYKTYKIDIVDYLDQED